MYGAWWRPKLSISNTLQDSVCEEQKALPGPVSTVCSPALPIISSGLQTTCRGLCQRSGRVTRTCRHPVGCSHPVAPVCLMWMASCWYAGVTTCNDTYGNRTLQVGCMYGLHRPTMYGLHRPTTYRLHRPPTYRLHRPTMHGLHGPTMYGLHRPTMYGLHRPTMHGLHRPTMYRLHRPTMYGLHRPTTYRLHRPTMYRLHRPTMYGLHWPTSCGLHGMLHKGFTAKSDRSKWYLESAVAGADAIQNVKMKWSSCIRFLTNTVLYLKASGSCTFPAFLHLVVLKLRRRLANWCYLLSAVDGEQKGTCHLRPVENLPDHSVFVSGYRSRGDILLCRYCCHLMAKSSEIQPESNHI